VIKERAGFDRLLLMTVKDGDNTYISSLTPGDFDGDAQMDVMVTKKMDNAAESDPVTVVIYWGDSLSNRISKSLHYFMC
jgi:hypothetical protein